MDEDDADDKSASEQDDEDAGESDGFEEVTNCMPKRRFVQIVLYFIIMSHILQSCQRNTHASQERKKE